MASRRDYDDSPATRDAEYGDGAAPTDGPAAAAAPRRIRSVRRARIGLVLLFAFLTELIVIAAAGNQAVTNKIDKSMTSARGLKGGFERAVETYGWRFSPRAHDIFHVWAGGLALIGTTMVISLLLILVLLRGPLTFGRAFFGAWLSVIVATMLGGYVRGLVIDTPKYSQQGIPARALFSQLAPGSATFLAGVALGLIVALVAGLLGTATRRPAEVAGGEPVGARDDTGDVDTTRFFDEREDRERFAPERDDRGAAAQTQGLPDERYGERYGYGSSNNPTRGVPWQGERPDAGNGPADSTETTALPAMRPREDTATTASTASSATTATTESTATTADTASTATTAGAARTVTQSQHEPDNGRGFDAPTSASTTAPTGTPTDADSHTAALPRAPQEQTQGPAQDEPTQAVPTHADPTQAMPAHADPAQMAPGHADPAQAQAPQGNPEPQQTMQFPRPPDDEDIEPDHR